MSTQQEDQRRGPLAGIKVLDFSRILSGPYASMVLADLGAEVVKVEPVGTGDFTRAAGNKSGGLSSSFLNNNRNKRSIALDLKSAEGVAVVKALAKTCDVFVQNFRPGVVERLGVGEADIRAVLSGHLCRCTGYAGIVRAALDVAGSAGDGV